MKLSSILTDTHRIVTVEETRIEVVVPRAHQAAVTVAARAAHPYETPAIDLYPLMAPGAARNAVDCAL